jgi:DNA-binding transcriptional regulator GbsR (MarR family)
VQPSPTDPINDFVERLGLLAERYGMPRIAGRMIGLLLIDGGEHTLDDFAERLRVSKASASTNARLLENIGILERVARPGDRRDFYRLGDDPWARLFDIARERMSRMRELLADGVTSLPPEKEEARERLAQWQDFYDYMLSHLDEKVVGWNARRTTAPSESEPFQS